jgi:hypothetical protein
MGAPAQCALELGLSADQSLARAVLSSRPCGAITMAVRGRRRRGDIFGRRDGVSLRPAVVAPVTTHRSIEREIQKGVEVEAMNARLEPKTVATRNPGRAAYLMFTGPFVQRLGSHVDAVGPDDGADLRVNPDLGEESLVGQWLEHTAPLASGEVDIAHESVLEGEAQLVIADDIYASDINKRIHSHSP